MKKFIFPAMMSAIILMSAALPVSAQNPDLNHEYKELLKKIMTLSGASSSSQNIISKFASSVKQIQPQQDDAYWEEFATKWTRTIEDKVMEVYVPIY